MNHKQSERLIQLSAYHELSAQEQRKLDRHLDQCEQCRMELKVLQNFHGRLAQFKSAVPQERDLVEARRLARARLNPPQWKEKRLKSFSVRFWDGVQRRFDEVFTPGVRTAFGAALLLAVGFVAGLFAFRPDSIPGEAIFQENEYVSIQRGQTEIANLKFADTGEEGNVLALTFDAFVPVQMKGRANDPVIQGVLAKSLLNGQNPGLRLKVVSAMMPHIQNQDVKPKELDDDVKHALVEAMVHDDNPGVRREALLVLKRFPLDDEIKRGFLTVLSSDPNEGLRAEAIDCLALDSETVASDRDLFEILKKKVETDSNEFIRQRAWTALKEVQ